MPKGQKPYKKEEGFKDKVLAAGDKLRAGLSKLRGPVEEMGKRVQKAAGPAANRFPEKKAGGGPVSRHSNSKIRDSEITRAMGVSGTLKRAGYPVDDSKTLTQLARQYRKVSPEVMERLDPMSAKNNPRKKPDKKASGGMVGKAKGRKC